MPVSILLADDHHVVRQGLRALLEAERDFSVVGEAGDGAEALSELERLSPDLILLDMMMPRLTGLEVARQARTLSPRTRIILLSMYDNEAYVLEAFRSGASAYVLKNSTASDLIKAVRQVVAGGRFLSPPLSERSIREYGAQEQDGALDRYETLTARERKVLELAAEGYSNPAIGAKLNISPRTVEIHRAHMMRKLDLRNHTDLVRFAIQRGIIPMVHQKGVDEL